MKIITNDKVELNVIDEGNGKTVLLLHGWSQTAEMFRDQIDFLKRDHRVVAFDMRGHGLSEKPKHGYRISRLSKDLHDLIESLKLNNIIMLGHSMGCSVIWSYIDLFGTKKISKLIFVDQQATMLINPVWNDALINELGASVTENELFNKVNMFCDKNAELNTKKFLKNRFTDFVEDKTLEWVYNENFKFPRKESSELLYNHMTQNWKDVFNRIDKKSLVITGIDSDKTKQSQEFISRKIPNCKLVEFKEGERGSHFMFIENPDKFNRIISDFIN